MKDNHGVLAWVFLITLSLIWGTSFILIKRGLESFSADQVGAIRVISAGIFLLPVGLWNIRKIDRTNLVWLFIIGLVGILIPAFLFAMAQTKINSSLAGILNALTPLFTGLIGLLIFQQKLNRIVLIGLIIGFFGSVLLITKGQLDVSQMSLYGLFVVGATICYGFNINLVKFKLPHMKALVISSTSLLMVLPFVIIYLFGFTPFIETFDSDMESIKNLSFIVILGVFGSSIAGIMFNRLVQLTNPIFTSSVTYLIPIVATIWGLADGEKIILTDIFGLLTIVFAVYLINRRRRKNLAKTT